MAMTAGTTEAIGPACLLHGSFTVILVAVEPPESRQPEAFLKLDAIALHDRTDRSVPSQGPGSAFAERAGSFGCHRCLTVRKLAFML